MKLFRTVALALVATTGLVHADTAKDTASNPDVQKFVAFVDKLVDGVVADKDNCTKMTADINALIDSNKDLLEKANAAAKSGKKLPAEAETHIQNSVKDKMIPALMGGAKCGNDKGVMGAMQRLDFGPKGGHGAPPASK